MQKQSFFILRGLDVAAAFQKCRSIRGGEESDFKVVFKKAISTVNFLTVGYSNILSHIFLIDL